MTDEVDRSKELRVREGSGGTVLYLGACADVLQFVSAIVDMSAKQPEAIKIVDEIVIFLTRLMGI